MMKKIVFALVFLLVSNVAFGQTYCPVAAGDAQKVTDASTSSGTGTVNSPSGNFQLSDVGKNAIVLTGGGSAATVITALGTIASRPSGSQIVTTNHASSSITGGVLIWFTADATTAINAQVTACTPTTTYPNPQQSPYVGTSAGTVLLTGRYFVSGCIYNVQAAGPYVIPGLMGGGSGNTIIYQNPTMTPCFAGGPQLIVARGSEASFSGFSVDGNYVNYAGQSGVVSLYNGDGFKSDDVRIYNWGSDTASSIAFSVTGSTNTRVDQLVVQGAPTSAVDTGCQFGGDGVVTYFCSNHYQNVTLNGGIPGPASKILTVQNSTSDECGDPYGRCMHVQPNSGVHFVNSTVWSSMVIGAGAVVSIRDSTVGHWNTSVRFPALLVNAGAIVSVGGSMLFGTGGAKSAIVNPTGLIYDELGNRWPNCNGTTCTERSAAQAITGPQPIRR